MGNCVSSEKDVFIYDDYIFETDLKLMKPIKYKNLKYPRYIERRRKLYDIFKVSQGPIGNI